MTPEFIIETKCSRCGGSGRVRPQRPGRPGKMPLIPCVACEQRGGPIVSLSILDRCIRMLADEPAYHQSKAGLAMAEWAIRFAQQNSWCDIIQAIAVAYQSPEFHPVSTARRKKKERRENWIMSRGTMGQIPSRRKLAERLASARDTTVMLMCLASYRHGKFSGTLYGLLTPGERSSMVTRLGFTAHGHAEILGVHAAGR